MSNTETVEPVTISASERTLTVATLHAVAESFVTAPAELTPEHIDMTRHGVTLAQFMAFADNHGARIRFAKNPTLKGRWVTATLATRELHGVDVRMTLHLDFDLVSDANDENFRTHNAECVITEGY